MGVARGRYSGSSGGSGSGIRRCESFHSTRDNLTVALPFQRSVSQPKELFAGGEMYEENFAASFNNLHLSPLGLPGTKDNSECGGGGGGGSGDMSSSYNNISVPFAFHPEDGKLEEYWGPYDREQTDRTQPSTNATYTMRKLTSCHIFMRLTICCIPTMPWTTL